MTNTSGHAPSAPTTPRRLPSDRVVSTTVKLDGCGYFLGFDRASTERSRVTVDKSPLRSKPLNERYGLFTTARPNPVDLANRPYPRHPPSWPCLGLGSPVRSDSCTRNCRRADSGTIRSILWGPAKLNTLPLDRTVAA